MTVQVILLVVLILALLLFPILLARFVKQPHYTYSTLAINAWGLIVIWVFAGDGSLTIRIILTGLLIINTVETLKKYKAFTNEQKAERH